MNRALQAMLCCLAAASVLVLVDVHVALENLPAQLSNVEQDLSGQITSQVNDLRGDTFKRIDAIEADANAQLTGLRKDTRARVDSSLGRVDTAIAIAGKAEADANSRLTDALKQTDKLINPAAAAATHAAGVAGQIEDMLPWILDCDPSHAGADCVPNRYLEIAGDVESALKAVSFAMPGLVKSGDAIATDVHGMADDGLKVTDKYTAPLTKWQKLRAALIVVGTIIAKGLL